MAKKLRNTAASKDQTEITARVEALIEILKQERILSETAVLAIDAMEEKIKMSMKEAGKK